MYLKKNYDLQITPGKNADLRSDFNLPEKKEGESDTNYISDCFKFIDKKLDYAKKEVSYWDAIKISDVVTSSDNYQSKINTLLPNTSIVVNTTFTLGGEVYNRGDIVYKKENGEEIHIHSQSGGIYEPSIVKSESENNNVSINYIYSDVISSEPITATFNINSAGSTYTQYNKIDGTEISDFIKKTDNGTILTTVYKITYTLNNTINDLKPIAKIFLVNEDNVKEEAYADIKITEGSIVDDKNVTHNVWKIETPIIKDGYLEVK